MGATAIEPEHQREACIVVGTDQTTMGFDRGSIKALLDAGSFFWADVQHPDEGDFDVLRNVFNFHPLAVEDSEHFGQRAKIDDYDDFIFLVVYGASSPEDKDQIVEVHCFYSDRFLVTVHHDDCPAFTEVRRRYAHRGAMSQKHSLLLYDVVDGLIDSFFPVLAALDDRIDELEDSIFENANDQQLQDIFEMKRYLVGMRKAITPQRDSFASFVGRVGDLSGLDRDDERYFRDIYDHVIRISEQIDSYRDLLSGAMDVYLSTVSNRLNVVMKQLTVIATVFLPLSWLTGFFGQNFGWLVGRIGHLGSFLVFGLGSEAVAVLALIAMFRKRGWF